MIISEKQIMQLIDIAYKFSMLLHDRGNHVAANGIEEFLEKLVCQQCEEPKEIK